MCEIGPNRIIQGEPISNGITSARSTILQADYGQEDSGRCSAGEENGRAIKSLALSLISAPPLLRSDHHKDSICNDSWQLKWVNQLYTSIRGTCEAYSNNQLSYLSAVWCDKISRVCVKTWLGLGNGGTPCWVGPRAGGRQIISEDGGIQSRKHCSR